MDYNRIYNQIIQNAQNRTLEGYGENHHILPKCMGGVNKNNIVRLTAREHFLCHLLLCEIYPNNNKLKYSLFLMNIGKQKNKNNHYKINNRTYERLKIEHSLFLTDRKLTEEHKLKIQSKAIGRQKNKEHKLKIGESNRKPKPEGFGDKISPLLKKRNIDWETRNKKASDKLKGRKITWELKGIKRSSNILGKPIAIQQYTLDGILLDEYKSIAEAANGNKSLHESIRCNVNGKYKTAGGFVWKRKIS
jgi:hypothetical protein